MKAKVTVFLNNMITHFSDKRPVMSHFISEVLQCVKMSVSSNMCDIQTQILHHINAKTLLFLIISSERQKCHFTIHPYVIKDVFTIHLKLVLEFVDTWSHFVRTWNTVKFSFLGAEKLIPAVSGTLHHLRDAERQRPHEVVPGSTVPVPDLH